MFEITTLSGSASGTLLEDCDNLRHRVAATGLPGGQRQDGRSSTCVFRNRQVGGKIRELMLTLTVNRYGAGTMISSGSVMLGQATPSVNSAKTTPTGGHTVCARVGWHRGWPGAGCTRTGGSAQVLTLNVAASALEPKKPSRRAQPAPEITVLIAGSPAGCSFRLPGLRRCA